MAKYVRGHEAKQSVALSSAKPDAQARHCAAAGPKHDTQLAEHGVKVDALAGQNELAGHAIGCADAAGQ